MRPLKLYDSEGNLTRLGLMLRSDLRFIVGKRLSDYVSWGYDPDEAGRLLHAVAGEMTGRGRPAGAQRSGEDYDGDGV